MEGKLRAYVGDGQFTNDPLETFGGAGVVEIPAYRIFCTTSASTASSTTPPIIFLIPPASSTKPGPGI
jgi:hypothetical protein